MYSNNGRILLKKTEQLFIAFNGDSPSKAIKSLQSPRLFFQCTCSLGCKILAVLYNRRNEMWLD